MVEYTEVVKIGIALIVSYLHTSIHQNDVSQV